MDITKELKIINDKKILLAERSRINYHKRKAEGRQKMKRVDPENKKKVGRKPKEIKPLQLAPTRGRKPNIINNIEEAPAYIKKLIKKTDTPST